MLRSLQAAGTIWGRHVVVRVVFCKLNVNIRFLSTHNMPIHQHRKRASCRIVMMTLKYSIFMYLSIVLAHPAKKAFKARCNKSEIHTSSREPWWHIKKLHQIIFGLFCAATDRCTMMPLLFCCWARISLKSFLYLKIALPQLFCRMKDHSLVLLFTIGARWPPFTRIGAK